MDSLASAAVATLFALFLTACETNTHAPLHLDAPPAAEQCMRLCCRERSAPCLGGLSTCGGCAERCQNACAQASGLDQCMDDAMADFICLPDGRVVPPGGRCTRVFDLYQAETVQCGRPEAAVGGSISVSTHGGER